MPAATTSISRIAERIRAALRAALLKPYAVDLLAVARFLDSPAGQAFLQQQTRAYRPLSSAYGHRDLREIGRAHV